MYYNDIYGDSLAQTSSFDSTWLIISVILAIVGGIVAYFLFVAKPNKGQYKGFLAWLHDFLNFKKFFIEMVLKVLYVIFAIFITLSSFCFISTSVAMFFIWLILGNILVRVSYEMLLMMITLVTNTTEINKKLSNRKDN